MTERSKFWDGTSLGDATDAPYSAQEFSQVVLGLLGQNNTSPWQRSFISFGQGYGVGSLLVTGTATPVSIAAGLACVAGLWYENDASTTLAVSTPAVNPRRDRVVLRADWATQTVRLALLAGAEAATPTAPALTQTFGTTWEVSLATVYVTTGGVITVTDERPGNIGLGNSVRFRDIYQREMEEWFEHFGTFQTSVSNHGGIFTLGASGTGTAIRTTAMPSALVISSGAANSSSMTVYDGGPSGTQLSHRLSQAPLWFRARQTMLNAAADAQTTAVMRLTNNAGTQMIEFGVLGSVSTTNLVLRSTNAGATSFNTGTAIDTSGAYHTIELFVPVSGGPVVALYDGVVIGQVAANLPASTTDMRAEFFVGNGLTNANRSTTVDWAQFIRGTS